MILVIGNYFQGKKTYIKNKLGLSDEDISDDIFSDAAVLNNFQDIKAELNEEALKHILNKKAVISLETGCRVLAHSEEERLHAEKINQTLQFLASKADSVVRVYCGIPVALKGEI